MLPSYKDPNPIDDSDGPQSGIICDVPQFRRDAEDLIDELHDDVERLEAECEELRVLFLEEHLKTQTMIPEINALKIDLSTQKGKTTVLSKKLKAKQQQRGLVPKQKHLSLPVSPTQHDPDNGEDQDLPKTS